MNIMDTIKSNYVSAEDLRGQDCHVQISGFRIEPVRKDNGQPEDEPVISFTGMQKSLVLNITNRLAIAGLYTEETDNWPGKWITLYPTTCQFGAKMVPCIRIRPFSPSQENGQPAQPFGQPQPQQAAPGAGSGPPPAQQPYLPPQPPPLPAGQLFSPQPMPQQTSEQQQPPAGQSPVQF